MVDADVRNILDKASGLDPRVEGDYTGWETEGRFSLSNGYLLKIEFNQHYGLAYIILKDASGTSLFWKHYNDAETVEYAWSWFTPRARAAHEESMRRQVKKEQDTRQRLQDFLGS